MTKVYPIILTPAKSGFVVTVPDLDINTQGADMAEAIYMARDAIGIWGICEQDVKRNIPEPSTTVPRYLKDLGDEYGIDCSQTLQKVLKEELRMAE